MHHLDTDKLYRDTMQKLHSMKKPQQYLANKMKCSRVVFWQLSTRGTINFENFFKLCDWLNTTPARYIKPKKEYAEKKRLNTDKQ